jgi:hypothetical protein
MEQAGGSSRALEELFFPLSLSFLQCGSTLSALPDWTAAVDFRNHPISGNL